ncbi:hypothetical protein DFJ73DRAFT_297321 [Zopfochytrium polystomum]|nr:hypothetical protein DFJ73DRAFT_297321 [Zopfochytrium polystomum]
MPDDDQSSSPASSSDKSIAGVPPSSAARNANVRRSQQQSSIIAVDDGIGVEPANECGDVPSSPATPPQRPVASPVHPSFSFSSESLPWSPRASQQTHSGKTSKITLSRRQQQQQQIPNAGSSSVLVPLISAAFDALAEPILVVQSGCGAQTLPPLARAPLVVIFANRAARILFGSTSASVEQSPSHSARITMSSPAASGITAPVSSPCSSLRGVSVSKLIPALRLSTLSSLSTSDVIVSSPYPKSLAVKRSTAHDKKGSPASPANTATTSPVIPVKSISKSFKARTLQSHGESSEEFRVHVSVSKLPPEALAAQLAGAPLPVHSARQSSSTARSGEGASTAWVLTLKKVAKSEKGLNSRYKSEFEGVFAIYYQP